MSPDPQKDTPILDYASKSVQPTESTNRRREIRRWITRGALALLALVVLILMVMPEVNHDPGARGAALCKSHLKQLALGVLMYAQDHGGALPDRLDRLYPRYVSNLGFFICLADPPPNGPAATQPAPSPTRQSSYVCVGGRLPRKNGDRFIIAYECKPNHANRRNIAYADCHVESVDEKEAQRLIYYLNAGINPPRAR